MADIYAIDAIYGGATTRTGNSVCGFNGNAGSIYNFGAYSQAPELTIYNSGGSDTLDCSGYSMAQTIDLRAGAFSSVGGLVRNIGIALNTAIENAIGGSGNDTLIANDQGCTYPRRRRSQRHASQDEFFVGTRVQQAPSQASTMYRMRCRTMSLPFQTWQDSG